MVREEKRALLPVIWRDAPLSRTHELRGDWKLQANDLSMCASETADPETLPTGGNLHGCVNALEEYLGWGCGWLPPRIINSPQTACWNCRREKIRPNRREKVLFVLYHVFPWIGIGNWHGLWSFAPDREAARAGEWWGICGGDFGDRLD